MAYYPRQSSGGGYGRYQILPADPNAGTQFNQLDEALNNLEGNTPGKNNASQIALAMQLAKENGLEVAGTKYGKDGNLEVDYKSPASAKPSEDTEAGANMAEENGLEPSGIKYGSDGKPVLEYGKNKKAQTLDDAVSETPSDTSMPTYPPSNSTATSQPSFWQKAMDFLQGKSSAPAPAITADQVQAAISQQPTEPQAISPVGSGGPTAAPILEPTPTQPINTSLPAMQDMMQKQAYVGNPIAQKIAALNKDAQDQQPGPPAWAPDGQVAAIAPDGRRGYIPSSQADKARAKGYKISGF